MEKYAKLMKGLEMCAGPDCCKDACPYYGETRGGKTCRAWLLNDAAAAIANEEAGNETLQNLLQSAEAERDKLHADVDDLEAAANTLRAERDSLRIELDTLRNRCQVQQNEINALLLKNGKQEEKTDRRSVGVEGSIAYWCGRADALAEVVSQFVAGEASGNE